MTHGPPDFTPDPPSQLDLTSEPEFHRNSSGPPNPDRRQFAAPVGVHFTCCHVYRHLQPPAGKSSWWAHCPRCGRRLLVEIGEDGSGDQFVQVH